MNEYRLVFIKVDVGDDSEKGIVRNMFLAGAGQAHYRFCSVQDR